ncbi:hydroxyacid-oxoacid transhydrogenase, mitochondrial-like [Anneissia japonica]|uniref:hydroxyacid-oxoacid transhydrogenase, mitochondrial-like n=1 Tax=Anneissia japonica TaxID=1529436 RepID=UPI00142582E2|nr:hydroxyacid-oxoacid transhydrogenase, mitochondrial-like [Anneissia japonica]
MGSTRQSVQSLMKILASAGCRCPAHSQAFSAPLQRMDCSTQPTAKEYAFEMACSNIRYGEGVTQEVGMDFKNLGAKNICVITDKNLAKLPPMQTVLDSLQKQKLNFQVFDDIRIEPTDISFKQAITFAKNGNFDAYLAVGGGSVMDTCKAANLYASNPDADFLDFVNAPIGKGKPVTGTVKPLIAVPTTSGTGSETTGVAIFDHTELKAKTGIGSRAIRPLLGIVDPLHCRYMPNRVAAYSGFDVLCHALESYTAIPYQERTPRPMDPIQRPAYQGSNPISDIWSLHALRIIKKYFRRAVQDPDDFEARSNMHLASVFAGIGFGNAGVHLCHGMSYAVAGQVKTYRAKQYDVDHAMVPHGLSVVMTAPAVFQYTASACPERHIEAANILGKDTTNCKREDAGLVLSDALRQFMHDLEIEDGLTALGYTKDDVPELVKSTLPQHRVTKLSPRLLAEEHLHQLFNDSMKVY